MIILFDMSQIVISASIDYHSQTKDQIELQLLRHITLSNILSYKKKFNAKMSEMIICCDGRDYWRKKIFPLYKQNRKKIKEKSKFDWTLFFENFNIIKDEVKNELPFNVVEVHGCEADDVIAVISRQQCPHQNKIIIVSSDKDLIQIQENLCTKTEQWSPFHKKFITCKSNDYSLFEHVVRGDAGDGIPNIFSDDDVFMNDNKRSKPIRASNILEWNQKGGLMNPEKFCNSELMLSRFKRNVNLIDLRCIPESHAIKISNEFNNFKSKPKDVFSYLTKHRLKKILESGIL